MSSKRRRSESNDIQPRSDALRPKTVSASKDPKVEETTNAEYKSELERRNRPIIEQHNIYNERLRKGELRILVLHPGAGSSKIKCELRPESLRRGLKYHALSYNWGNQENLGSILLRGFDFAVTPSLAEALGYLRDPHSETLLWVDAICINQYDKEEKEAQLKSMHLIYQLAKEVIAWLGPPNNASHHAFFVLNMIKNEIGTHVGTVITARSIKVGEEAPDDDKSWIDEEPFGNDNPFGELMAQPYWSRAWIVQEIMCAKFLSIQCGYDTVPYKILEDAFRREESAYVEISPNDSETEPISFHGESEVKIVKRESQMLSSKHYLDCFLDRQCEKRHDNIYAFRYLLRNDIKPMRPNYERNIRKLVLKMTLKIIESTQSLHVITIKGRQKPPRAREEAWQRGMPSWCPYLATPYRCRPIEAENGPNLFAEKAIFSILEKKLRIKGEPFVRKRMQIRGFVIGRVSRTISQRIPPNVRASSDWYPEDIEQEFAHYKKCVALGLEGMPKDCLSRFMSLVATTRTLLVDGRDEYPDITALRENPTNNLEEPDIVDLRRMFKNRISRSVCSFELSRTAKEALDSSKTAPTEEINRIALIPHTAREGDEICVILGCTRPVVLHKIRKHYVVLGEAYIDTVSMGKFKVSVKLRDFIIGGSSFENTERFVKIKDLVRGANPL